MSMLGHSSYVKGAGASSTKNLCKAAKVHLRPSDLAKSDVMFINKRRNWAKGKRHEQTSRNTSTTAEVAPESILTTDVSFAKSRYGLIRLCL